MEASPRLYHGPLQFASQAKLFSWLDGSKVHSPKRVRSLTLRMVDVDLTPLVDAAAGRRDNGTSAWGLYQRELVRLDEALMALSGLEHLVIIPPDKHRSSTFVKSMYTCFLTRIPLRCTKLKRLTLHDNHETLQQVPELTKLANVVFEEPVPRSSSRPSSSSAQSSAKAKREEVMVKKEMDCPGC